MALPKNVTGYRWIDKDPVIDVFREAQRSTGMTLAAIANKSGVSATTLRKWDKGETRKPQHITIRFAMAAMGYKEKWINGGGEPITANYRIPNHTKRR